MKKLTALLLILSFAAALFAGCGAAVPDDGGNGKSDNTGPAEAPAENETKEEDIPFPHEVRDFGGTVFRVLIDKETVNFLDIEDLDVTEINGDVLNDAYYDRKCIVEETYNTVLEGRHETNMVTFVNKVIQSGDDEYDAYAPRLMNAGTFAANGYAVNLLDTDLTLGAPWWDQNIVRDTSIGGAAYFIAGDIFTKHYDGISLLMFNKKLADDLNLESPYQLVSDNKWTIDKFNSMVKGVTADINGDGVMNRYDRYGFITQLDYISSILNACGERIASKDKNDLPVFTGATEKISNIIDKMLDIYVGDTYCLHRDGYDKEGGGGKLVQFWIFPEGRGLFYWSFPRYIDLGLRDMEDDFGILPLPKWDPEQSRYYAALNNWHSYTYMIPRSARDASRSAYIMDALAYHGRKIIKPAYYDVCLQRKYARDEESSAMLDIIFSSTVYDLGSVYDIGGYIGAFQGDFQKGDNSIASSYEKVAGKIDKSINDIIEQFETNK